MSTVRLICLAALVAAPAAPAASARAQGEPPLASMTTSRLLLLPAQEMTGAPDARAWLARFDSVVTSRLEDGGIGNGWAYPRDAIRSARNNPSYATDPRSMGTQPLKGDKVKEGFVLPQPFASRVRTLLAITDARHAIVPVAATLDTVATPRAAHLQLTIVDGRASKIVWRGTLHALYEGSAAAAADSLAAMAARLFVK